VDQLQLQFLQRLVQAMDPSGFEQAPAAIWREEAVTFADEVTRAVLGNPVGSYDQRAAQR
jgi:putative aminopeptidase FrvX